MDCVCAFPRVWFWLSMLQCFGSIFPLLAGWMRHFVFLGIQNSFPLIFLLLCLSLTHSSFFTHPLILCVCVPLCLNQSTFAHILTRHQSSFEPFVALAIKDAQSLPPSLPPSCLRLKAHCVLAPQASRPPVPSWPSHSPCSSGRPPTSWGPSAAPPVRGREGGREGGWVGECEIWAISLSMSFREASIFLGSFCSSSCWFYFVFWRERGREGGSGK